MLWREKKSRHILVYGGRISKERAKIQHERTQCNKNDMFRQKGMHRNGNCLSLPTTKNIINRTENQSN